MSTKQKQSHTIPADSDNDCDSVDLELERGFLTIDQDNLDGGMDRVRLSPEQVAALKKFLARSSR